MTKLSVVQFGSAYGGLTTVGYTIYDEDNVIDTARTTTGVSEIGTSTGIYTASIEFDDGFTGFILWDTGGASPVYSAESVQPLDASEAAAVAASATTGLGIVCLSLVSAVADNSGDDSPDALIKILRLINTQGPGFCSLTDWHFLRSDLSFSITTANYKYSGASYLPANFKRVITSYMMLNNHRYDLVEVGIKEAADWENPSNNQGRPDEFCITRIESNYWEVQFNRQPDQTYTVYLELELQWTDADSTDDNLVVTQPFFTGMVNYVTRARLAQQGDAELLTYYKTEWYDPFTGRGLLVDMMSMLKSPFKKTGVIARPMGSAGSRRTRDYAK